MFRTTSRRERATSQVQSSAASMKAKMTPAAQQARENAVVAAEAAREWASPRVEAARDWAAPRIEHARVRGVETAAPKVEAAAEALEPRVDAARDKIVEDVLPRLVAALTAAAAAASAKTEEAHDRSIHALRETEKHAKKSGKAARKAHRKELRAERRDAHKGRRRFILVAVVVAAAGAGWAAWKRSQPTEDPWAAGTGTSPSYTSTGDRLSGGDTATGLGSGTIASESTDVSTPPPDGSAEAQAKEALASGEASSALDSDTTGTAEVPGMPAEGEHAKDEDGKGRRSQG